MNLIKLHFSLIIVLMLVSNQVLSQFNMGIKSGANMSKINYAQKFQQDGIYQVYNVGFMGGLTFQYINQTNAGIQFDALYIQKGFISRPSETSLIQYQRNIDYISVPFLMNAFIGRKKFSFNILLGLFGSYAISSSETLTDDNITLTRNYQFDNDFDNRFEMGLQGGAGIRHIFKFGILELEGNFAYSLTSIYKWGVSNKDPEMDKYFEIPEQAQNQSLQFTLSYLYSF